MAQSHSHTLIIFSYTYTVYWCQMYACFHDYLGSSASETSLHAALRGSIPNKPGAYKLPCWKGDKCLPASASSVSGIKSVSARQLKPGKLYGKSFWRSWGGRMKVQSDCYVARERCWEVCKETCCYGSLKETFIKFVTLRLIFVGALEKEREKYCVYTVGAM